MNLLIASSNMFVFEAIEVGKLAVQFKVCSSTGSLETEGVVPASAGSESNKFALRGRVSE